MIYIKAVILGQKETMAAAQTFAAAEELLARFRSEDPTTYYFLATQA